MERRHIAQEGELRGEDERDALYGELLRILEPLERIGDLLAATADKATLSALAYEFGLESYLPTLTNYAGVCTTKIRHYGPSNC